jgi:hypothetical protein
MRIMVSKENDGSQVLVSPITKNRLSAVMEERGSIRIDFGKK